MSNPFHFLHPCSQLITVVYLTGGNQLSIVVFTGGSQLIIVVYLTGGNPLITFVYTGGSQLIIVVCTGGSQLITVFTNLEQSEGERGSLDQKQARERFLFMMKKFLPP